MNIATWTLQILLALVFLAAGVTKLTTAKSALVTQSNMRWAADFTPTQIRLIGVAEIAGAAGLIVPAATGILPVLTPVAAAALALLMVGAAKTLLGLGDSPVRPLGLAALAAVTAVLLVRTRTS